MVWGLASSCRDSRSVKNACRVGASAVMAADRRGGGPGGRRPNRTTRVIRSGTSYSDLGITGITPILGLFRCPLLPVGKRPGTLADALRQLSRIGIIRRAHGDLFLSSSP